MAGFKFASAFSGIGGFDVSFLKAGGECVFASEIDKFAQKSYEALYGGEHLVGDITEVIAEEVPDHDVFAFGTPCQSFSVAGKRLGFEDTRGTLFFEAMRIAKAKKPRVLLMENVKGLVSHDKGKTLETMILAMNEIGYTVDFDVLNSKYFGVPQNRERIFIVAVRDDLVTPEPWRIEGTNVVAKGKRRIAQIDGVKTFNFEYPTEGEVMIRLRDILEDDVDERYYLSEEKTAKLVAQLEEREKDSDSDSPKMVGNVELRGNDSIKRVYSPVGVSPTLTTMGGGHREPKVAVSQLGNVNPSGNGMNGAVYDIDAGLSPTLTTNKGEGLRISSAPKYRIRKLTPLECWRLQGFSDLAHETVKLAGVSDSQRYKQAGNAVTVNVIDALMPALLKYVNPPSGTHKRLSGTAGALV